MHKDLNRVGNIVVFVAGLLLTPAIPFLVYIVLQFTKLANYPDVLVYSISGAMFIVLISAAAAGLSALLISEYRAGSIVLMCLGMLLVYLTCQVLLGTVFL